MNSRDVSTPDIAEAVTVLDAAMDVVFDAHLLEELGDAELGQALGAIFRLSRALEAITGRLREHLGQGGAQ